MYHVCCFQLRERERFEAFRSYKWREHSFMNNLNITFSPDKISLIDFFLSDKHNSDTHARTQDVSIDCLTRYLFSNLLNTHYL